MTTQLDLDTPTQDAITQTLTALQNTLEAINPDPVGLHTHRILEHAQNLAGLARQAERDADWWCQRASELDDWIDHHILNNHP